MQRIAKYYILFLLTFVFVVPAYPYDKNAKDFRNLANEKNLRNYPLDFILQVADTVIANQYPSGGWSKEQAWSEIPTSKQELRDRANHKKTMRRTGAGSTIDNGATTSEIKYLCKVYELSPQEKYRESILKGINFLLASQDSCGGWPQFWPTDDKSPVFFKHITFNDNAMINVMNVLKYIYQNQAPYSSVNIDMETRDKCKAAFDKGVECILNLQVRINDTLTVWCAQYDEVTLQPASARAFERESLCGTIETRGIINLLLRINKPSERVKTAIRSAIAWLKAHAIRDTEIQYFTTPDGKKDFRLVYKKDAPLLWARCYDLENMMPFYGDFDKQKHYDILELDIERRNGYSWLNTNTSSIISQYEKWELKHGQTPKKQIKNKESTSSITKTHKYTHRK